MDWLGAFRFFSAYVFSYLWHGKHEYTQKLNHKKRINYRLARPK